MLENFIHSYTVKEQDGQLVLVKDGKEVFCHKLMPFPQQNSFGQVQLVRMPCTLNCGKANIVVEPTDNEKEIFVQSCDGTINRFVLEKQQQGEQDNKNKLVVM